VEIGKYKYQGPLQNLSEEKATLERNNGIDNESESEPDNDSPAMHQILGKRLCALATNSVVNPIGTFLLSGIAGGSGTTLVIQHAFDGLDGCDTSNLGGPGVQIGLVCTFAVLSLVNTGIGYLGAKQHADNFIEVKENAELSFSSIESAGDTTINGSSADDVQESCSTSPGATIAINAGMIFLGLFVGALVELFVTPTELGGSGCDVESIETGSKGMGIALAVFLAFSAIAGYCVYRNRANADQVISETTLLNESRFFKPVKQENF